VRFAGQIAAAALAALVLGLLPAGAGAATQFQVGAAAVDTTPPPFDADQDLVDFPEADMLRATICPRAVFDGPRLWRFEEPYEDTDGSGDYNYPLSDPGSGGVPTGEPYCDYNHNGRWDGLYSSGQIGTLIKRINDPIDARAIAIGDGDHTVVIVSVVAQGLHENYLDTARNLATAVPSTGNPDGRPQIDDVVISANHNESSPDTVGIYGAPVLADTAGENSGIDDYYYEFLQHRIAHASAEAFDAMQPATLRETEFNVPPSVDVDLSTQFPTVDDADNPAAIDPKVRVLQARSLGGDAIATVMNLAAHNQEIGHDAPDSEMGPVSSDWPGAFHDKLEADVGGIGMFLVADNGSMEDPTTVPATPGDQYAKAHAVGERLADIVESHLSSATNLDFGTVGSQRRILFVPLENNVFRAAATAGLFGQRQLYTGGVPSGRAGNELKTSVATVDVGPDLQLIANPGEAFPALMLGSPWGIDDPDGVHENVGCPDRPNPPVPTWHASAPHRFQVGLADDMIGYEIPPWAFSEIPGVFVNQPPNADTCTNDPGTGLDPAGHGHKLETEGVGPSASFDVADQLTSMLDEHPDPDADVRLGRFVLPDGHLTRRAHGPLGDAVAVWLADPGSTTLGPGTGTIVALDSVGKFGSRPVDDSGTFIDFDGAEQGGPDVSTRGMHAAATGSSDAKRHYVDVYPHLDTTPLGASAPPPVPSVSVDDVTVTEGDSGTTNAVFTVALSEPTPATVKVDYHASPRSATLGSDFLATSGTLTFPPNDTSQTVGVQVVGDTTDEPDEEFALDLSDPVAATLGDAAGLGTILDDDPTPTGGGPGGGGGTGATGTNGTNGAGGQNGSTGVALGGTGKKCKRKKRHGHRRRCHHRRHRAR